MISVVIRNKNEAGPLEKVLSVLTTIYKDDIGEIIVVDNNSTDNSLEIAKAYNCKVAAIEKFSYGRAINRGIALAKNNYVLLLSAHAVPIGKYFFRSALDLINSKEKVAGIRYINSFQNYSRALANDFIVKSPLENGLMAACCIVNKEIWQDHKFDEELPFSEDKEWSKRVMDHGFYIYDLSETFFYFVKRSRESLLTRYKNETLAYYQLAGTQPHKPLRIILSLLKKLFLVNPKKIISEGIWDIKKSKAKLYIYNVLRKK